MKREIKNIVIVGGGTAGWVAAHQFLNRTINSKVTVVCSEEIGVIGVGESTTARFVGQVVNLKNTRTNINELEFLKRTGSTFKYGILHRDWHTIGEEFYSPLGDDYINSFGFPTSNYDNLKIYSISKKLKYQNFFNSLIMKKNKVCFANIEDNNKYKETFKNQFGKLKINIPTAYHLDSFKTAEYLKEKCLEVKDCEYVNDTVVEGIKNEDGTLSHIITKTGKKIYGDLFIDCTGFFRLLISKVYKNNFISYKDNLLVNRAFNFMTERKENENIKSYTHTWAQQYGWMWQIPLQHRTGNGYVYSDNYTTPEKAQEEIEKVLGQKINPIKDIKFESGRIEKSWIKNVLSIGLSTAFIEPLQATAIHATCLQLSEFLEQYYTYEMDFNNENLMQKYNTEVANIWDDLRDFLTMHYMSPRKDTQFWIDSSSEDRRTEKLKEKFNIWKTRMPRSRDYSTGSQHISLHDMGSSLYYQILMGMKLLNHKLAEDELKGFNIYNNTKELYEQYEEFGNYLSNSCLDSNIFFEDIEQNLQKYKNL
jgi:hypothetical protein